MTTRLKHAKRDLKERLRPVVKSIGKRRRDLSPRLWKLDVDGARLALDGHDLHGLLQRFGSPLHVVHARALDENVAAFQESASSSRCDVFYSYKTNPVPGVLRHLHARGVGAEVISPYELWLALRLGVPPERIIYNGPAKSDASIEEALRRDILLLNANHREELPRIAAIARRLGRRARIGIRVATGLGWTGQFGIPIEGGEALDAFRLALSMPELDVQGVHSHLGRHIVDEGLLRGYLSQLLDFVDELRRTLSLSISFLDVGGSLEVPTVGDITPTGAVLNRTFLADLMPPAPGSRLSIASYARTVVDVVTRRFEAAGAKPPRIVVEPGRALTGNTQMLLATVLTTKEDREGITYAILDAGINLAESAKHEYHQLFSVNHFGQPATRTYRLCGPICTPSDVLYPAWDLPEQAVGDALAIMDAGAYFVPFATSFSFPQPAIVLVDGPDVQVLRRAEPFEHLLSLDEPSAGS